MIGGDVPSAGRVDQVVEVFGLRREQVDAALGYYAEFTEEVDAAIAANVAAADEGHDVLAASDDPVLATLDDEELLRAATREGRAVVTENARDFDRIVRAWAARGEHHGGVVFTSPRRYHRGSKAYPENLTNALAALIDNPPASTSDWVHWMGSTCTTG